MHSINNKCSKLNSGDICPIRLEVDFQLRVTIIGSDNGLLPGQRQVIIWTTAAVLSIGPWGTNFSTILITIETFSLKKIHLKMSSENASLGLNKLNLRCLVVLWSESKLNVTQWILPYSQISKQISEQISLKISLKINNILSGKEILCQENALSANGWPLCWDLWSTMCRQCVKNWWKYCWTCAGISKNAYKLVNLKALKFSTQYKSHIIQCMVKIFCVEFQRYPLKFHTKYLIHTLKDVKCVEKWGFKSS